MMLRVSALGLAVAMSVVTVSVDAQPKALFSFHSNAWLNLHHFIRLAARGVPARAELSEQERAIWAEGVEFYKPYAARDLGFDQGLVDIKYALHLAEGKASLEGAKIDPALRGTLERVMPIYQKHWWPAHDRANREWITAAEPLVARHGEALRRDLARVYGTTWPAEPLPVDVSVTAGASGAYETGSPTHITISSEEPNNRGYAALEILFHESSHQWSVLYGGLAQAAKAQGVTLPPQLWHSVLFYTAGALTRRALAASGVNDYVELSTRLDLYTPMCGAGCREKIVQHWGPRLDGKRSVAEALSALVASFK